MACLVGGSALPGFRIWAGDKVHTVCNLMTRAGEIQEENKIAEKMETEH